MRVYRNISLLATGQLVDAADTILCGYFIYNNASSTRYIKFYNKATAPTVGTDTPVMTLAIPAGSAANLALEDDMVFTLGLGIGATTGVADADTGAPSANDVVVNLFYK